MEDEFETEDEEELEEEDVELQKLSGKLNENEKVSWNQLESQFILLNKQFADSMAEYGKFIEKHEGLKTLEHYFVIRNVMVSFPGLLNILKNQKKYLLDILGKRWKVIKKYDSRSAEDIEEKNKEIRRVMQERDDLRREVNNLVKVSEIKVAKENAEKIRQIPELNSKIRELQGKIKEEAMERDKIRVSPQMREAYERHKGGESQASIGRDMKKDKSTINKWIKKVEKLLQKK